MPEPTFERLVWTPFFQQNIREEFDESLSSVSLVESATGGTRLLFGPVAAFRYIRMSRPLVKFPRGYKNSSCARGWERGKEAQNALCTVVQMKMWTNHLSTRNSVNQIGFKPTACIGAAVSFLAMLGCRFSNSFLLFGILYGQVYSTYLQIMQAKM